MHQAVVAAGIAKRATCHTLRYSFATHLLLDNMDVEALKAAVKLVDGRVPTEASGGVTLETIRAKAETGVTFISVGRLTQSAPAADIGLDFDVV